MNAKTKITKTADQKGSNQAAVNKCSHVSLTELTSEIHRVYEHTTHVKLKYYMCYKVSAFLTESLHQTSLSLEFKVSLRHVDGPGKLVSLGLIVDFLYWYLIVLTPVCMKKKQCSDNTAE